MAMLIATAALAADNTQAFYILFHEQVVSPDWQNGNGKLCQNAGHGPQGGECVSPQKYENGVFIASPQNMTKDILNKVRKDVKNSKVVAYWDFGDMPLNPGATECPFCGDWIMGTRPNRNCSTTYHCGPSPFLSALRALPGIDKLAVHNITAGLPGVMLESYPGLARYTWTQKLATMLADFFAGWLKEHGFDGMYLDGCTPPSHAAC